MSVLLCISPPLVVEFSYRDTAPHPTKKAERKEEGWGWRGKANNNNKKKASQVSAEAQGEKEGREKEKVKQNRLCAKYISNEHTKEGA